MTQNYKSIAFQGALGAYSDMACRAVFPNLETVPCDSFDQAFQAITEGRADLAMIPVDNSIAGRVADVHHLIPQGEFFIIGEHFQPVNHMLLGVKGAKIDDLEHVHSHIHAIPQCRNYLKTLKAQSHVHADTAGAAREISEKNDKAHGAIASALASDIYDLDILAKDIEDQSRNVTRFLIISTEPEFPELEEESVMTSLLFEVGNIPAALYKAMGGFATNGLSMTKLESYVDKNFQAARFYCDIEGHPESLAMRRALAELDFFAKEVRLLGAYKAHEFRKIYVDDQEF